MEPADLNSPPPDDRQTEAWYRANITTAPLPDDGFTDRVLAALPSVPPRAATSRRLFCLAGALVGTVLAVSRMVSLGFTIIVPENLAMPDHLASPALALATLLTAASLWYVFRPRLNFLPRS